jgi:hypothetical protein
MYSISSIDKEMASLLVGIVGDKYNILSGDKKK